jgi:hypothetical protein
LFLNLIATTSKNMLVVASCCLERKNDVTPLKDDTNDTLSLEMILTNGLPSFYAWLRSQARKAEPVIFIEGHLAGNPLASYINAQIGSPTSQVHLYEGVIYTSSGAQPVSEDFQRFLRDFHKAFEGSHVTAGVLSEWIAQGRPLPYRSGDSTALQGDICQALARAVSLVRTGSFLDPNQPTDEECLGIALAKYCSWEGPRIACTCLRLCYAALEDANYAALERLLREYFGEETFR